MIQANTLHIQTEPAHSIQAHNFLEEVRTFAQRGVYEQHAVLGINLTTELIAAERQMLSFWESQGSSYFYVQEKHKQSLKQFESEAEKQTHIVLYISANTTKDLQGLKDLTQRAAIMYGATLEEKSTLSPASPREVVKKQILTAAIQSIPQKFEMGELLYYCF